MCLTRNSFKTIVTAKCDKPVEYVKQQDAETSELMVTTVRKSTHHKRQAGTTDQQLLKLWQAGSEERDRLIRRRTEGRQKKQAKMTALGEQIQSGQLVQNTATVCTLMTKDLLL